MIDAEKHGDTMGHVETFVLVDTLANTLAEEEANTPNNILVDAKAEAQIDKLVLTFLDASPKTLWEKKGDVVPRD